MENVGDRDPVYLEDNNLGKEIISLLREGKSNDEPSGLVEAT